MKEKKINETGRSMVEMLGVLAIIGVLSIGAVSGYRWAMDKMVANEIIEGVKRRALIASVQRGMRQSLDLSEFDTIQDKYTIHENDTYNGYPFAFTIQIDDLEQSVCEKIISMDWKLPTLIEINGQETTICAETNILTFVFNTELTSGDACKGFCQNGSICLADGSCYCQNGWSGDYCITCEGNVVANYCCQSGQIWNTLMKRCVTEKCPEDGVIQEDGTCDNDYCEDNSQCPKGQYCKFTPSGCANASRGFGRCISPIQHTKTGNGWIMSSSKLDWWSANNFCQALGLRLVNRAEVCDGAINSSGCAVSPTRTALKDQFGSLVIWTREDGTNDCYAVRLQLSDGIVGGNYRTYTRYALCH